MDKKAVFAEFEAEEVRVRKILEDNADDFEELQSEWQERDSAAERNLREVEWSQYNALQEELVEIEDAKARLAKGTYGICEDCGEKISENRLSSVLTAKRCIKCQTKIEKEFGLADRSVSL